MWTTIIGKNILLACDTGLFLNEKRPYSVFLLVDWSDKSIDRRNFRFYMSIGGTIDGQQIIPAG